MSLFCHPGSVLRQKGVELERSTEEIKGTAKNTHTHTRIERFAYSRDFVWNVLLEVCPEGQQRWETSFAGEGDSHLSFVLLTAVCCSAAMYFPVRGNTTFTRRSAKSQPTLQLLRLSEHPEVKVVSQSYRKSYPTHTRCPNSNRTTNTPSAPSRLPGPDRTRGGIIGKSHPSTTRRVCFRHTRLQEQALELRRRSH